MTQRIVDLSIPICNDIVSDPEMLRPRIEYWAHDQTFAQIAGFFPGLKQSDLPDGEGWAVEDIKLTTHSGTHIDAPWHFHSTTDNGATRAPTIDEAPLDLFIRPAVKLDFRKFPDGYVASARDVADELDRIGYTLQPLDIVLVNTSAGSAYGRSDYIDSGCGMGAEATLYLTERGIRVVGTDAWSWDAPFSHTARRYAQSGNASIVWEGHKAGRINPYYQMEKLHALEQLPPFGYIVSCLPVKIKAAGAAWIRAIAILDDTQPAAS